MASSMASSGCSTAAVAATSRSQKGSPGHCWVAQSPNTECPHPLQNPNSVLCAPADRPTWLARQSRSALWPRGLEGLRTHTQWVKEQESQGASQGRK